MYLATPLSPTMAMPLPSADWTTAIASSDWSFASNLPPSPTRSDVLLKPKPDAIPLLQMTSQRKSDLKGSITFFLFSIAWLLLLLSCLIVTPPVPCWSPHCFLDDPSHSCYGAFSGMLFSRYLPIRPLTSFRSFLKFLLLGKSFHGHPVYNFTTALRISFSYLYFLWPYGMVCLFDLFIVYLSHKEARSISWGIFASFVCCCISSS